MGFICDDEYADSKQQSIDRQYALDRINSLLRHSRSDTTTCNNNYILHFSPNINPVVESYYEPSTFF